MFYLEIWFWEGNWWGWGGGGGGGGARSARRREGVEGKRLSIKHCTMLSLAILKILSLKGGGGGGFEVVVFFWGGGGISP